MNDWCYGCNGLIINPGQNYLYSEKVCNCQMPQRQQPNTQLFGQQQFGTQYGYNPYTLENIVKILERIEQKLK